MSGYRRLLVGILGCVACISGAVTAPASASIVERSPEGSAAVNQVQMEGSTTHPVEATPPPQGALTGAEAMAAEEARSPVQSPTATASTGPGAGSEEAVGSGSQESSLAATSTESFSLSSDTLLIAGALTEAELLQVSEEAHLASPEAVQAREESQTAYSGLGISESKELAGRSFPSLVHQPDSGPPPLTQGQRITGFPSDFSATLALAEGKHAAITSMAPIAVNTPQGRVAIDPTPHQTGSGYEAATPAAGMHLRVGTRLSEGVSLPDIGVTLTPVTEGGTPLEAAGAVDSQAVFYGNSEDSQAGVRDMDSLVKIGTYQFSEETILRSQFSPSKLYFRVGLPEGASLVQEGSGAVTVRGAGQALVTITAPDARDAEGTVVRSVSMSVSGNTITVNVPHQPGEYRMPIDVDPTVSEGQSMGRYQMGHSWWFYANSPGNVFTNWEPKYGVYGMEDHDPYSVHYKAGEYGLFGYETQGESRIYEFVSESYDNNPSTVSSTVYIGGPGGLESPVHNAEWTPTTVCAVEGCPAAIGEKQNWANGAFYKQGALAEEWWSFEDLLRSSTVYIVQEKGPSVSSGACGSVWTKASACNIELSATDPGIGVSEYTLSSVNAAEWGTKNKVCTGGFPCSPHVTTSVNPSGLPEGEDTIKATAQDPVGLSASAERGVKIDNAAPHKITLSGLPSSKEIGAGEYKLRAEATDGEGTTHSSGMMWLSLVIDGREVGSRSGSCPLGPCSAHAEWTISGREYGTGRHTIAVVAADNAGNSATEDFTMTVHPASPVALGPGTVNPQSGELTLQATDVSMGDGLSVSRSYNSRHLTRGTEGPISAQWGFALGSNETLAKQADGSMVLTDSTGAQTNFASDGKGGFTSPLGDSNLTLSSTPCVSGQNEYMLSNAAAKTTTCFKTPSGTGEVLVPSIAEGPVATDTVTYSYQVAKTSEYALPKESQPRDIVRGPDGNLWFTDYRTSRIGRITTSGTVAEYRVPEGSEPVGITSGPDGNLWFTDLRTSKVGKITTSGSITEYSLPAASYPVEITTGPDNNLWITEEYTNKIIKMTTAGATTEYSLPTGSGPEGITSGPDGNLWFVDREKQRVVKMTTAGAITEYSLPAESYPEDIVTGPDKNLWFTDEWSNKIGRITTAGAITEYALPAEARPHQITVGPDENLWFTEANARIGKITTTGAVSEFSVPWESSPAGIAAGPDGYVWYTEESTSKIAKTLPLSAPNQPSEALAPVPAGVSCSPELKPGCRALTFNYAATTTATGENSSEWGDYAGHLTRVYFTAYDPVSKAMKTVEAAHYLYDKQGRLRTEWDPRISPALKTTYGYDAEGHVTALTPPGQESWAITYGTIANDGGSGRVLKVLRAPVSAPLWAGTGPIKLTAPAISGSAVVGVRMAVSNGSWSGSPVAYAYQWEDCNVLGGECKAIPGATNPNYKPTNSDLGHTLVTQVTATNGGGSVVAPSAASAVVASTAPGAPPNYTQTIDSPNSLNAVSCVPNTTDCVVSDSLGKAFYATNVSAGAAATWNSWTGPGASPTEAVSCPTTSLCLLAAGSNEGNGGNLYYATSLGGAWTEAYSPVYGVDAISCTSASFCVDGQDNYGYFRYATSPASTAWNLEDQGEASMKGVFCLSTSFCAIADGAGSVHIATTTSQVESSSWTATNVDGTTALNGVACTSTTLCVAVDGAGNVLNLAVSGLGSATATKHNIDGANSLVAVTCTGSTCVTVDNQGNIFVSTNGGESWVKQLALGGKLTSVSCASVSLCVTAEASGKVTSFNPSFTQTVDGGNSLNAVSCIPATTDCVVSDSLGKAFYATNVNTTSPATWKAWSGPGPSPSEAVSCPTTSVCVMAAGSDNGYGGNMYYATALGGAWTLAYSPSNGVDAISCSSASFCVDGQDAYGYFRYSTSPASTLWELEEQGSATMKAVSCLSSSFCAIVDSAGNVHVATSASQVESSAWTQTNVDGTTALNGVACTSTTSCVAVDGAGNVLNLAVAGNGAATATKQNIDGTNSLTGVTCSSSTCVAVDNHGNIFVSTNGGTNWTKQYVIGTNLTSVSCASTSLCVAADTTGNITAFNPAGTVKEGESRPAQPGSTVEYGVPLSGSGLPTMTAGEVEKWSQKDLPTEATAIFPPDEPQGWPASGYKRATILYRDSTSRTVNVENPGGAIATSEYNEHNDMVRSLSPDNRATALKEAKPAEAAKLLDTQSTYNGEGTELLGTVGPRHLVKLSNGKEAQARNHTVYTYDEGAPLTGGPYRLATKVTQGAQVEGEPEQDIQTTVTSYSGQENLGWKLRMPTSTTVDPTGLKLTRTTVYDPATGNVTETRTPASKGAGDTHDELTVYYTAAANATYPACGGHPEWANLPCETLPGKQPETPGVPNLPVSTLTYNMYDEPLNTTSTVSTNTRTSTVAYDEAGRPTASHTTSSTGKALPEVIDKYNSATGALAEQSATEGASTWAITSAYNTIGQLTAYTDADGNTTKYEYEGEGSYQGEKEKDSRLRHIDDGKGTEAYKYDETTGTLTKLEDKQGVYTLTFTAAYDAEGNMTTQTYPNGMSASYTRNQAGETTGLSYVKTTNCSENCTWFADTAVLSTHGQWMTQQSTLNAETYTYDNAGRLTQTLENVGSEGCTTHIYAYDEETNRTSLTTRPPGVGGACAAEGGTVEQHTYDSANRLTDPGVTYEPLGETSKMPAADAGGYELQSTYYANGRVHEQSQHEQWIGYELDPAGRTRKTTDTGTVTSTYTSHYTGPGDSPAWTVEPVSGHWTRYVQGLDGLAAVETDTEEPTLRLQDLEGNVVATASISETATKLLKTERPTDYGVPTSSKPEKYSWLGGDVRPTELASGVIAMGARSYVPQLGRFLQTDPVTGGSANAYAYVFGDPIYESDPSGEDANGPSEWAIGLANEITGQEVAAYEQAEREEAERKAAEAAAAAAAYAALEAATALPTEGGVEEAEEVMALTIRVGGRHHHGKRATAALFGLKAAFKKIEKTVSSVFKKAKTAVETLSNQLWEDVNSELFQKSLECVKGADDLYEKLEGENWKEYPLVITTIYLVGCAGGTEDVEWG